jgi:hypothetical protein
MWASPGHEAAPCSFSLDFRRWSTRLPIGSRSVSPAHPYVPALRLIDAIVAAFLIAGLAFGMVLAICTFDDIAVLRAGPGVRILRLGPLFEGLESTPGDYEYRWVWFLLFSSIIPSILDLSITATAFLRGLPGLNRWILNRMPADKAVRERHKLRVAAALTGQVVGGVGFTGAAAHLFVVYLIPLGLPAFGAVVREFARALAAYNAPARATMWLARPFPKFPPF